ncbi:acyl-CoA dehydrogenase NM domain-like protein [Atractiella rhizophila]|nr:acyl-CoA dehydrogenase NM domain-like protein [Atractiella rhizophila]
MSMPNLFARTRASSLSHSRLLKLSRPPFLQAPRYKTTYSVSDPLQISSLLTSEETDIRESMRSYAQEKLMPRVVQGYRNESFDRSMMKEMGELGFLGATIEGYGCAGVSSVAGGMLCYEIERVDSGYRSAMSVQSSLAMQAIYMYGTEKQKETWLPRMAQGDVIGAFGLTEPDHGSDPASMKATAREAKGSSKIVLNGEKTWITMSPNADIFIVWAKCEWDGKIRGFIVEKDLKGVSAPKISNKIGLRASVTGSIILEDVEVDSEASLLPNVSGLKGPFGCLNHARFGISFGAMGALQSAFDYTLEYSLNRKQFDRPLASFQLIQKKLADVHTEIAIGLLACIQLGRLKDEGKVTPEMISLLKRNNCGKALEGSRKLMDVFGGNAIADEYHIGRIVNNLYVVNTYEGTHDIHALILGKAITGIPAFAN